MYTLLTIEQKQSLVGQLGPELWHFALVGVTLLLGVVLIGQAGKVVAEVSGKQVDSIVETA